MFLPFFQTLREEGVPVSVREFLGFLEGMAAGLVIYDPEGFYHFARTTMVKDERHIDRFDRAFARAFSGLESITPDQVLNALDLPHDWLERLAEHDAPDRCPLRDVGWFAAAPPGGQPAAKRPKDQPANDKHSAPFPGLSCPCQPLSARSATAAMSLTRALTTESGPKP